MVLGYLRARRAADPEDLLGEVFLQLVRDIRRFEGGASEFRSWVFVVAHHRFLDDVRSRRRRPVELASDEDLERAGPTGDAQSEALLNLGWMEVRRLLEGLSEGQREVILLRVLGDMKVAEIAEALGRRPGAVQALLRRGLAALKKQIERKGVQI